MPFYAKADALHVADEWPIQQRAAIGFAQFTRSYSLTTALAPSPNLFVEGAILINRSGERFTDELDKPAYALAGANATPEQIANREHANQLAEPSRTIEE